MALATCLGSLICSAGLLSGSAAISAAAEAEMILAPAIVGAAYAHNHDHSDGKAAHVHDECCNHCKRGLLQMFKRNKCKCEKCVTKVVKDHCKKDPCCGARRKLSFLRMLRRLLGCHDPCCDPCAVVGKTVVTEKVLEKPEKLTAIPTESVVAQVPVRPIIEAPRLEFAADYSWVQGSLKYVHVNGGAWVVRYAPLDQTDRFGGSMVLARDARMDRYQEGDFVRISGEILSDRSSIFLGGALYRVEDVTLVQSRRE